MLRLLPVFSLLLGGLFLFVGLPVLGPNNPHDTNAPAAAGANVALAQTALETPRLNLYDAPRRAAAKPQQPRQPQQRAVPRQSRQSRFPHKQSQLPANVQRPEMPVLFFRGEQRRVLEAVRQGVVEEDDFDIEEFVPVVIIEDALPQAEGEVQRRRARQIYIDAYIVNKSTGQNTFWFNGRRLTYEGSRELLEQEGIFLEGLDAPVDEDVVVEGLENLQSSTAALPADGASGGSADGSADSSSGAVGDLVDASDILDGSLDDGLDDGLGAPLQAGENLQQSGEQQEEEALSPGNSVLAGADGAIPAVPDQLPEQQAAQAAQAAEGEEVEEPYQIFNGVFKGEDAFSGFVFEARVGQVISPDGLIEETLPVVVKKR